MKAIREDENGVEVFYHSVTEWNFDQLLAEANGKVENIQLYGRVFESREAEEQGEYQDERGAGYVYAMDYSNREHAAPGTSCMSGPVLILGWDGQHSDEEINLHGEYLVPLSSYKVIGVMDAE